MKHNREKFMKEQWFEIAIICSVCRKPIEKVSVQDDARTSLSVDECDPKNPKCVE